MASLLNISFKWLIGIGIMSACVERIEFDVPPPQLLTVVEGTITDQPGPYVVKLSRGLTLDADSSFLVGIENAKVTLFDHEGNQEDFTETTPGVYATAGTIQGKVGGRYHIRIQMPDGKVYESQPDELLPVGEIKELQYRYEARTVVKPFGEIAADVFNVFIDADAGSTGSFVRWRFTGTYRVKTDPEQHLIIYPFPYLPLKSPWPCSGYVVGFGPEGSGGILVKTNECTCCVCWVRQYEQIPQLSDTQLISNNQFKNVKVGEVPINNASFYDKYWVNVEQLSLTRKAYDFFKLVRSQKEGASSLFQPPSGEIRGNIIAKNSSDAVIGIFYASAIKAKSEFILPSSIPYPVTPIDFVTLPCYDFYKNATSAKPSFWL